MIDFPNPKLNLGLYITGRRTDGYHNIETCFFPVRDWYDVLEILPAQQLSFKATGLNIPDDGKENLCLRAYHLLKSDFDLPPVSIFLHKVLPVGGGLGGGSSDAAFTLKLLNEKFDLGIEQTQLLHYAAQLGSDCPFFILNRPCLAKGRGEILEPIPLNMTGNWLTILVPPVQVSTREAYAGVQLSRPNRPLREILFQPDSWRNELINGFESTIFGRYPLLATLKEQLYAQGAWYASMSGSGACIFGLFYSKPNLSALGEIACWCGRL